MVDPMVSVAYRFGIASALLFSWCALRRETIALSFRQHGAAIGVGCCTFTIGYTLNYRAEAHVASAVVALIFAGLAFVNLIIFRFLLRHRSSRTEWVAASVGATGVGLVSWSEIAQAKMDIEAQAGVALAVLSVLASALGNVFARRGEQAGAPLTASTAWAMGYGTLLLAIYVTAARGHAWTFERSRPYILSLLYLAVMSSAVAFLLYFGLARRRGYNVASYILAITPLLAMVMSTLFEGKRWNSLTMGGVALVIVGQWLLLGTPADQTL
jgi:drug/metabolite transporter (DMT)-like permease